MLDKEDPILSIRRQCELTGYNRSNCYYMPHPRTFEDTEVIMARLDYWNTQQPAWGVKTLVPLLMQEGYKVSHDMV